MEAGVALAALGVLVGIVTLVAHDAPIGIRVTLAAACLVLLIGGLSLVSSANTEGPPPTSATASIANPPPATRATSGNVPPLVEDSPDLQRYHVQLNEWCESVGATRAVLSVDVTSADAVRECRCLDGRPIDWPAACRLTYPNQDTEAVMTDPNDAYSVKCRPT
jgi:hypothetical protein